MSYDISYTLRLVDKITEPLAKINKAMSELGEAVKKLNPAFSSFDEVGNKFQGFSNKIQNELRKDVTSVGSLSSSFSSVRKQAEKNITPVVGLFGKVDAKLKSIQDLMNKKGIGIFSSGGLGGLMAQVGSVVGVGEGVRTIYDFNVAMNQLHATTLSSSAEMEKFNALAMNLGKTTQFTASQVASAMNFLAMAGLKGNDILQATPSMLNLAAAGAMDLGNAADVATNVMSAFSLKVTDLSHVSDVMATVATSSNTNVMEMADAFKYASAMAHGAGLSIEQTGAMIGVLGDFGIKGSMAGTAIQNFLRYLLTLKKDAKETFKTMGVDIDQFYDKAGKIKNLGKLISTVIPKMTIQQQSDIFGERGVRLSMALQSKQGGELFQSLLESAQKSSGTAKRMAEIQMSGLVGSWKEFSSALENVFLGVGGKGGISSLLSGALDVLTKLLRAFGSLPGPVQTAVVALGGIALVGSPAVFALRMLVSGITGIFSPIIRLSSLLISQRAALIAYKVAVLALRGALLLWRGLAAGISFLLDLNPIGAAILAVGALVAAVYEVWKNWGKISSFVRSSWEGLTNFFKLSFASVSDIFSKIYNVLPFGDLIKIADEVKKAFVDTIGYITLAFSKIVEPFTKASSFIKSVFSELTNFLKSSFNGMLVFFSKISSVLPFGELKKIADEVKKVWSETIGYITGTLSKIGGVFTKIASFFGYSSPSAKFSGIVNNVSNASKKINVIPKPMEKISPNKNISVTNNLKASTSVNGEIKVKLENKTEKKVSNNLGFSGFFGTKFGILGGAM